jgi:hypothetical protein
MEAAGDLGLELGAFFVVAKAVATLTERRYRAEREHGDGDGGLPGGPARVSR